MLVIANSDAAISAVVVMVSHVYRWGTTTAKRMSFPLLGLAGIIATIAMTLLDDLVLRAGTSPCLRLETLNLKLQP